MCWSALVPLSPYQLPFLSQFLNTLYPLSLAQCQPVSAPLAACWVYLGTKLLEHKPKLHNQTDKTELFVLVSEGRQPRPSPVLIEYAITNTCGIVKQVYLNNISVCSLCAWVQLYHR